jgi:type I restriction enzyme M protein
MKLITQHVLQNREKLRKSTSVLEFVDVMFPPNRKNAWANRYIYGIEINLDLATATKVNMVGHGDGSANIESKDALIDFQEYTKDLLQISKTSEIYPKPVNEQFDVVISNPPFSVTIDRDTAKNLPKVFMWGERIAEQLKKAKKKMEVSTENLFIERWYQLLRPKGRLGVVLPESVFDVTANKYVRLFLYKYFWIKAIVSLPELAFQPYTPTKTSLLFAQKKTPEEVKEWDKLWNTYLNEYHLIRKRIEDLFKVRKGVLDYEKSQKELVDNLKELLGDNFDDKDGDLDIRELKEKYAEEIELADQDWWVFRKISQRLNYKIFMAHVDEIGYKRGLRGEEERENQLFQVDQNGNIIIDTENPKKVLDYLRRDVKWS